MFQSFDEQANPQNAHSRLKALRKLMQQQGIDAFLVPHSDEYQGEYVPNSSKRLEWLTGFTGSAGFAIILQDKAVLFIDGRYSLQARQQTDPDLFSYQDLIHNPPALWLQNYLQQQQVPFMIGFDPWLHNILEIKKIQSLLPTPAQLKAVAPNPIDEIWHDRPSSPKGKISLQPIELTGRSTEDKLAEIRHKIQETGSTACLLTDTAGLAWAFNIRGKDVEHTPVALGYALIPANEQEKAIIFMDEQKLSPELDAVLCSVAKFRPLNAIAASLKDYTTIMLDPTNCAEAFRLLIANNGHKFISAENPTLLPKAVKTEAEINGAKKAHLHDGVAMVRFLAWIDEQYKTHGADSLDEINAAKKLEECRQIAAKEVGTRLEDISFDTISGVGANGAIIHYRVTTSTNRKFQEGELYLVDSGGQYRHGTTDITRTIAIGKPGFEEQRCFTLVLKGMIALTLARFPEGTRGRALDSLVRNPLWQNGLDFAHGTGHGVGSYLNVHEGPQNISPNSAHQLLPNMIISNEPGYYRENAFGIRIENLLKVHQPKTIPGGNIAMLGFETLTLCPIDKRLILIEELTEEEKSWLNSYHNIVYEKLSPFIRDQEKDWFLEATGQI